LTKFFITYIFIGVAGTAGIHYGVPLLPQDARISNAVDRLNIPTIVSRAKPTAINPRTSRPKNRIQLPPEPSPVDSVSTDVSDQPPQDVVEDDMFAIHETHWGVIMAYNTGIYDPHGKLLRTARPGTQVQIIKTVTTERGDFFHCNVLISAKETMSDVIVASDSIDLAPGEVTTATPKERRLRVRRAQLLASIEKERGNLRRSSGSKNPHNKDYSAVTRQLNAFYKNAEVTRKKWESTKEPAERNTLTNCV
jgi:hypothetical protein